MAERSNKQIAAGHRRRLLTIKKSIEDMAADWEDLDEYNITTLEALSAMVGDTADRLTESV
ncbi:MAG: hypothetical protein RR101_14640 [Burkholderiaceae bacterium]